MPLPKFKFSKDEIKYQLAEFVNNLSPSEKKMIILFSVALFLVGDYWVLLYPAFHIYKEAVKNSEALNGQWDKLKKDSKNKDLIDKNWNEAKAGLKQTENSFVGVNETPLLLENLSKLALDTQVKITSLKPVENMAPEESGYYARLPIKIEALAGTHELGKFMGYLEGGTTFFRIVDLKVSTDPNESKKDIVEMNIEALRKK